MGDYGVSGGASTSYNPSIGSHSGNGEGSTSFYPSNSSNKGNLTINTGNAQYNPYDNNNSPAHSSFPQSSTSSYPYSATTDHGYHQPQQQQQYQQQDQYGNGAQMQQMYDNYGNVKNEQQQAGMNGYSESYNEMNAYASTSNQQQQQQQQQQQMQYSNNARPNQPHRTMTDNFGTVGAGPPEPGKMDMLPHGHKPYTAQQKNKARLMDDYQPVAPTSGRTNTTKGSSTTSEFTKRKNWSQRIVEEMQDVLHVLSPSGVFLFASPSVYEITGYTPEELVGRGITDFIERDDIDTFIKDFTGSIHNDTALTTYFRFRRKDDRSVLFEVTGQAYYTDSASSTPQGTNPNEPSTSQLQIRNSSGGSKTCKCLFAMARLYPSKNNAMLDSFLELKMENEKLRQKLAEIYKEIEGEPEDQQMMSSSSGSNFAFNTSTGDRQISGFPSRMSGVFAAQNAAAQGQAQTQGQGMGAQYGKGQQPQQGGFKVEEAYNTYYPQAGNQQQGFVAPSQTGGDGRGTAINQDNVLVSSSGLIPSNSNTYGALGIGISNATARSAQQLAQAFSANNNTNNPAANKADGGDADGEKKKKMKKARTDEGEFVCRDCGTVDSPEWRRGPLGPKTLCNACGLRWAKKNKQQNRLSMGDAGSTAGA